MIPVLGLVVAVTLAQAPTPQASAPTAHLAGRVTVEGTNAPLADARVVLMPMLGRTAPPPRPMIPMAPPPQAITDQDGRFAFPRLRPGEYRIDVQRTGYAPLEGEGGRGRTIQVTEGQSAEVELQLQKGAVISGRILSPSGEPQTDVRVMALRRIQGPQAQARLLPAPMQGVQQTNDLGEFRLAGLPPGEYFVSASPQMQSPFGGPGVAPPAPAAPGTTRTSVTTTYYPGTTDAAAAQPVSVARGAEVGNISFMLQSLPAFRVSGVVVDEEGKPVGGAFVNLMNDPRSGPMVMGPGGSSRTGEDGRFTIASVVAGSYHATASVPIIMNGGAGGVATWSATGSAAGGVVVSGGRGVVASGGMMNPPTEVVVADADVTGVRIVVRKPQ
jgi:protocatechuate 3,4-dioxygenase beta subunit